MILSGSNFSATPRANLRIRRIGTSVPRYQRGGGPSAVDFVLRVMPLLYTKPPWRFSPSHDRLTPTREFLPPPQAACLIVTPTSSPVSDSGVCNESPGGRSDGLCRSSSYVHAQPPEFPARGGSRRGRARAARLAAGGGEIAGGSCFRLVGAKELSHYPLDARRAQSHRHVGPEARCAAGISRGIRHDSHESGRRATRRPTADVREDHGQVVDRAQPAPRGRWTLQRRPDLFHRVSNRPQSGRKRYAQLRVDRRQAAWAPDAALTGVCDDPADGAGHRTRISWRRMQAIRDACGSRKQRTVPRAEF